MSDAMGGTRLLGAVLGAALLAVAPAGGAGAQEIGREDDAWRFAAGIGAGLGLTGHDLSEAGEPAGLARLSVQRRISGSAWLGGEWVGTWLDDAPGGAVRHSLSALLSLRPGHGSLLLRASAGLALATVADVEGPPPGPIPGDANVGIGEYSGVAAGAGIGLDLPVSGSVAVQPGLDLLVHRAGGHTLSLVAVSVRVAIAG